MRLNAWLLTCFSVLCPSGIPALFAENLPSRETFDKWCEGAIRGDAGALYNLGLCYRKGLYVVEANAETAAEWFLKAAEAGFVPAQIEIANCYDSGTGVSADRAKAAEWLRRVAESGFAKAQYLYGVRCMNGDGVRKDKAEAVSWFKKAADQKMPSAQFYLGYCYAKGEGVEADGEKAFKWFEKAAKAGLSAAQYNLGLCYYRGDGVEKDEEEAAEWFEKAARQNFAQAQYYYGECLFYGRGVRENRSAAFPWLKKATENEIVSAHLLLGRCYLDGMGTVADPEKAVRHFRLSSDAGNKEAKYYLGTCLLAGKGVKKDEAEALALLKTAATAGVAAAQFSLGTCFDTGVGVVADTDEAEAWFKLSAAQGYAPAESILKRKEYARSERAREEQLRLDRARRAELQQLAVAEKKRNAEQAALAASLALNVDRDIPENPKTKRPVFVCAIANEDYSESGIANVPYAKNDGEIFVEYAKKTLGVPARNVKIFKNATAGVMLRAENWIERCAGLYPNSEIIFYYAGHGVPVIKNEKITKQCLLPTDVSVEFSDSAGVDLNAFLTRLGNMKARQVTVFLDTCFSGMNRDDTPQIVARGVRIEASQTEARGNMVVFSSASGDETSLVLNGKKHGLFTYCLLRKLQETKGKISYRELGNYLKTRVPQVAHESELSSLQTPTMRISGNFDLDRKLVE